MLKRRWVAGVVGVLCLLALPASASALKFSTAPGSPITGLPSVYAMQSADFNNDGRDDLASITATLGNGISIRLAQSDGSWSSAASVDSSNGGYSFATGDFNNDNKVDLAVYRIQVAQARVFFGNGDGTFGSEVAINAPWTSSYSLGSWKSLTTGDLNFDGYDDIVFPLTNGRFAVSLSNGSGGFSTANASQVADAPSGPGDRFSSAAIGDFNDDSHADIALGMAPTNLDDPSLSAVFVMLGDGAGNFTQAPIHGFNISQPAGYAGKINSLAVGNFNGVGGDDLAVATNPEGYLSSSGKGTVQTFFGDSSFGLIGGSNVFKSDNRPGAVIARDFDNDSLTDLAWLERITPNGPTTDQVVVARGNGSGGFSISPNNNFAFSSNTVSSTDLVSGDFNLDGSWDFAAGFGNSGTIRMLQNAIDPFTDRGSIDFGDVVINSAEQLRSVVIGNAGGPTATIDQVTINGTDASAFSLPVAGCVGETVTPSCLQGVKFNPTTDDSFSANLHITFENSSEVLDIPLSANVIAPGASFDPDPLGFGQAWINSTKTRTVKITSTGDAVLFISNLTSITGSNAGRYAITNDGCSNRNLAPTDSCFIDVKLTADGQTGIRGNAQLNVVNDGYLSPQSVALTYEGINPGITVNPSSEDFGPVTVGSSEYQTFTVTSTGTTALEIDDVVAISTNDDDFSVVENNCPASLAVGQTCQFEVEFAPSSSSPTSRTGQVEIGTNLSPSTRVVPLTGSAQQAEASYSVESIDFGDVPVGKSAKKTIVVTNSGNGPMEEDEAWLDGPDDGWKHFSLDSDSCTGVTVPVGGTCSYTVAFNPTERGSKLTYTAVWFPGSTGGDIEMTGNGTQPGAAFDAQSHDFGQAFIGSWTRDASRTFYLTSSGLDPVHVGEFSLKGPDASSFVVMGGPPTCESPLAVGAKCPITIEFSPPSGEPGARNAVLSVETDGGTREVSLSGTAVAAPVVKPESKLALKLPKKTKVKKVTKIKVRVTISNTGTVPLVGARLSYSLKQGKGKARVSGRVALATVDANASLTKNVTLKVKKSKLKRTIKSLKINFDVIQDGSKLASKTGTTRLDFGQAKIRRPKDVSSS